jgi:hypothetical protein
MEKESAKIQLDEFDAIKGLSIYWVVCIHIVYSFFSAESKPLLFDIYNYFTQLAVPFFMILGGFFFAKKYLQSNKLINTQDLAKSVKNTFSRIVIPYYIFAVLLAVNNIVSGKNVYWKQFLFIDSNSHGLYFLIIYTYSLIFSICLLKVLQRVFSNKNIIFMMPIVSLLFFPLSNYLHYIFPSNKIVLDIPLITFFSFGIPIYFFYKNIFDKYNKSYTHVIFVLCLFISIFTLILFFARKYYGSFPVFVSSPPTIYRMVYCITIFMLVLIFFSNKKNMKYIRKTHMVPFGVNSLFIFLIHPYFLKFIIPMVVYSYGILEIPIFSNYFFVPMLLLSYLVTFLSYKMFTYLPVRIQNIFSR